jgi:hypothetical protein
MKKFPLVFLALVILGPVCSQSVTVPKPVAGAGPGNYLTVYLIPSKAKYDWSSPSTLYHSYMKNYIRNILKKEKYLLGHAFLELQTDSDPGNIMTGMRSTNREQQKNLVLEEKYGLSILGAGLEGRLQEKDELQQQIEKYSRRKGKLTFMRFLISDEAAEKMTEFFQSYRRRLDSIGPQICYGGAFWPRYYGEGSGCSALVVSFMEVAGLMTEEFMHWIVEINIPMDLIGGPYNHEKEVEFKAIKDYTSWSDPGTRIHLDYEPFRIYDPTLMAEWVDEVLHSPQKAGDMVTVPVTLRKAKGLEIDARQVPVPQEPVLQTRTERSIFIDYYLKKPGSN